MKEIIKTFKVNKEVYKVMEYKSINTITSKPMTWYTIETPENCFGYCDHLTLKKYEDKNDYFILSAYNRKYDYKTIKKCKEVLMNYENN